MSSIGNGAAQRLVEARARRAISENLDDRLAALELGRAFLPGLNRDDAKAWAQLAAGSPDADPPASADQIRGLSTVEARKVGEIAFRGLDGPAVAVRRLAVDLLAELVRHRPEPLGARIHRELREKAIFDPPLLYRDAGIAETRELLALIDRETDRPSRLHNLLLCLAWTRHDLAAQAFRGWQETPPEWAADLENPLADYPSLAGWRLADAGERVAPADE